MFHFIIAIQEKMKKLNEKTAATRKQTASKARGASPTSSTNKNKPKPDKSSQADR